MLARCLTGAAVRTVRENAMPSYQDRNLNIFWANEPTKVSVNFSKSLQGPLS